MRIIPITIATAILGALLGSTWAYVQVGSGENATLESALQLASIQDDPQANLPDSKESRLPKALVEPIDYDFGTMQQGTTRSNVVRVTNVGGATLNLKLGTPTCKCTVGELSDDEIEPGETVEIRMEWTARTGAGEFRQSVPLTTNDPRSQSVSLSVFGMVTEPTGLIPGTFAMGKVTSGKERTATVQLLSFDQDEVVISSWEFNDPANRDFFEVQVSPIAKKDLPDPLAKSGARIDLKIKKNAPLGRLAHWLTIKTNLPDAEQRMIDITGQVVGDIAIHGRGWISKQEVLKLGQVLSSEGKEAKLRLAVRGEFAGKVDFEVVEVDPPELMVTLGKSRMLKENLQHLPLTVKIPKGTRPMIRMNTDQGDDARVVLKTTHPTSPEFVFHVRFSVSR